jgi:hypothetical protein
MGTSLPEALVLKMLELFGFIIVIILVVSGFIFVFLLLEEIGRYRSKLH